MGKKVQCTLYRFSVVRVYEVARVLHTPDNLPHMLGTGARCPFPQLLSLCLLFQGNQMLLWFTEINILWITHIHYIDQHDLDHWNHKKYQKAFFPVKNILSLVGMSFWWIYTPGIDADVHFNLLCRSDSLSPHLNKTLTYNGFCDILTSCIY